MNTHYGVLSFTGDPDCEHPDEELRGKGPQLTLIACGGESFCWEHLAKWTEKHPLRLWESVEVLQRDPIFINDVYALMEERNKK